MSNSVPRNYETSDLPLAAAIYLELRKLVAVEGDSWRRTFVFPPEAEAVAKRYYAGEVKVDPREYAAAMRDLKGILHRGVKI